jgi:hypothetical protein
MRDGVKWASLLAGIVMLALSALDFVHMAIVMEPFGGIPWSWNFVALNPVRFGLPVAGLALLATGLVLFVRGAD